MLYDIASSQRTSRTSPPYRTILLSAAGTAIALSFAVAAFAGTQTNPRIVDPGLERILQFMVLLKFATVAGALWLVDWRLHQVVNSRLAAGYIAAVVLMASAPALMWQSAYPGPAAVLFHAGLLMGLLLGWRDGFSQSRR